MRLAVIADIHGNLPALEAVVADLRVRRADAVVNLGDCVSGPLWPAETLRFLRREGWPIVRGNHDRWVGELDHNACGASDRFAIERLTREERDWLGTRPTRLALDGGVLAVHACPADDTAYLLEEPVDEVLRRADPATVATRLGAETARLILTAHSHLPGEMRLADGRRVLNPGSVGCPAYGDDSTCPPHVSESGSPSARYAIVDMTSSGTFSLEFLSISYPHADAVRRAEAAGRIDWAHALRTGFARRTAA